MKLFKEFKEFAVKGNVIDLAVGVVLGGAFSKLTQSFVNDLLMPFLSYITGNIDVTTLSFTMHIPKFTREGKLIPAAVEFRYGAFMQTTIDFVLIAFFLFLFIKFFNSLKRKSEDVSNKEAPTPKDILLLTEIRDLLKNQEK